MEMAAAEPIAGALRKESGSERGALGRCAVRGAGEWFADRGGRMGHLTESTRRIAGRQAGG